MNSVLRRAVSPARDPWLAAIVGVAAVLRFAGLGFGLPNLNARPDESPLVNIAVRFFGGDLNPHFFNYPTFFIYLLFALYVVFFAIHMLLGGTRSSFQVILAADPSPLYLIARGVSAVLGTATVIVVYRIANRFGGRRAGLCAALFMAVCYLHVRDSHFGVTDVTMTFLVLASVDAMLRAMDTRRDGHLLVAAILAGLAAGTKYGGMFLVAPLLATAVGRGNVTGEWGFVRQSARRLAAAAVHPSVWLAMVVLTLTFVLTTPFALADFRAFSHDFTYEVRHLGAGQGIDLGPGWWYHMRFTLPYGAGWLMLASSFVGAWIAQRIDRPKAAVACLFPLLYFAAAGRGHTVFLRYMVPIVPFVCAAAGLTIAHITEAVWPLKKWSSMAAAGLAFVVASESLYATTEFLFSLDRTDNRVLAAQWIDRELPSEATICQTGYVAGHVQLRQPPFTSRPPSP